MYLRYSIHMRHIPTHFFMDMLSILSFLNDFANLMSAYYIFLGFGLL